MWPFGERFPYADTHELNLDWILKQIKEFNDKIPGMFEEIGKKLNAPEEHGEVGDFLINVGQGKTKWENMETRFIPYIMQAVDEWLDEHPEATSTVLNGSITIPKFNNEVFELPFNYPCNIVAEFPTPNVQGGCWIENNRYVFGSPHANNMCRLYEWDSATNTIIRTVDVEGYHANAIAFDPSDRYLYIADCLDVNNNYCNTITVIDYDRMTFVTRITAPVQQIYSIAFDRDTNTFYSSNFTGTTEGVANVITEYNGIFESVKRQILLDDLTVRYDIHHSSQGVQCVKGGIAYIPYYDPSRTIVGYDLTTGKRIIVANIPEYLNNYKYTGELEAITYNEMDDSYIVFAAGKAFEIGLFKSIPIDNLFFNAPQALTIFNNCYVDVEKDYSTDTKPVTKYATTEPTFRTIADAVNAGKNMNKALHIILTANNPTEYGEPVEIEDFSFRLTGKQTAGNNIITLTKYINLRRCTGIISNINFSSTNTLTSNSTSIDLRNCNMLVFGMVFQNNNANYDIVNYFGSWLQTNGNTYNKGILNSNGACINALEPNRPRIVGFESSIISNFKTTKTVDVYDLDTLKGTTDVEVYVLGNIEIVKFANTLNYTFNTMLQLRGFDGMVIGGMIYVNDDYGPITNMQANLPGGRLFLRPNVTGTNIKLYGYAVIAL